MFNLSIVFLFIVSHSSSCTCDLDFERDSTKQKSELVAARNRSEDSQLPDTDPDSAVDDGISKNTRKQYGENAPDTKLPDNRKISHRNHNKQPLMSQ